MFLRMVKKKKKVRLFDNYQIRHFKLENSWKKVCI